MKYIKQYEAIEEPQIGDYVICEDGNNRQLIDFLCSNIGKIIRFRTNEDPPLPRFKFFNNKFKYMVLYENIPENLNVNFNSAYHMPNCRAMSRDEIKHFSHNKEYLEQFIINTKYNL